MRLAIKNDDCCCKKDIVTTHSDSYFFIPPNYATRKIYCSFFYVLNSGQMMNKLCIRPTEYYRKELNWLMEVERKMMEPPNLVSRRSCSKHEPTWETPPGDIFLTLSKQALIPQNGHEANQPNDSNFQSRPEPSSHLLTNKVKKNKIKFQDHKIIYIRL